MNASGTIAEFAESNDPVIPHLPSAESQAKASPTF
jgi:hypothetical protein